MSDQPGVDTVDFGYSNLSGRPVGRGLRILSRILPGVRKVELEIAPYAAAWHEHNVAALASTKPLWVALGDSLSQGVGASSIKQSWVLQAQRSLAVRGFEFRVVNLSMSGATVIDVLDRQVPALDGLAPTPALVTVLVGSNDVVHHDLRVSLLAHDRALLAALPAVTFVAVSDWAPGVLGQIERLVESEGRSGAVHAVRVHLSNRLRAEDHFHLNDEGYALVADDFAAAIIDQLEEPG